MVEHVGASRRKRTTPIATAISEYGASVFDIEELEQCELEKADERESYYIQKYDTLHPLGYNVQKSSRCNGSSLFVDGKVLGAELRGIKANGVLAKVRLLIEIEGKSEKTRVMFGVTPETYEKSIQIAKEYCETLGIVPTEHSSLSDAPKPWWPYKEKLEQFDNSEITRIRIIPFSANQVRVCVKTSTMKSWKEEVKMTFGSKKIDRGNSLKIALTIAEELKTRHNIEYSIDQKLY